MLIKLIIVNTYEIDNEVKIDSEIIIGKRCCNNNNKRKRYQFPNNDIMNIDKGSIRKKRKTNNVIIQTNTVFTTCKS